MLNKQGSGRFFRMSTCGLPLLAILAGGTIALAQDGAPPAPPAPPAPGSVVKVDDHGIANLHVVDEDLANVLEMLSIQSQRNIVASRNVSARVTANLYGVTFYEALDAVLNVNGFGYREEGKFIYVYTFDELKQINELERLRVSKVLKLNYLNSIDAAEFVKPLLSEKGQIKTNGKTANFPSIGDTPIGGEEYAHDSMLVVYDFEENVAEIETLIGQIDTRPAQVLVEATILQTALNEANAFGVDFSIISDLDFGEFVGVGGPLQAANALIGGRSTPGGSTQFPADGGGSGVSTNIGNVSGPGGLKVGIVSNDVAVFMRVLDEVTDTTILSNPKILALNRQPSRVLVGRKVGYLQTTSTDTATTQSVEFLDTGTQLYFRPFVTNEGMIRMELKPQVSEAVIRETSDATGAAVTIPDEITNELVTNVIVRDGQTVVLGGLFRESTVSTRRQVPFLGDIPIVGRAFRGNDDETQRNEIIFLITPTIVNDTMLTNGGVRGMETAENARAGARNGLLFWSREKRTAQLNVEADRLVREGKNDEARWKLKQSLWLNTNQPEAIRLREQLDGEVPSLNRSMLDHIIHGEAASVSANWNNAPTSTSASTFNMTQPVFNQTATGGTQTFNTDSTDSNATTPTTATAETTQASTSETAPSTPVMTTSANGYPTFEGTPTAGMWIGSRGLMGGAWNLIGPVFNTANSGFDNNAEVPAETFSNASEEPIFDGK